MIRIADDFTSIRQEMERIEAERGGGKVEIVPDAIAAAGGYVPLTIPAGASIFSYSAAPSLVGHST